MRRRRQPSPVSPHIPPHLLKGALRGDRATTPRRAVPQLQAARLRQRLRGRGPALFHQGGGARDAGRCGEMWGDTGRYGETWRCFFIKVAAAHEL